MINKICDLIEDEKENYAGGAVVCANAALACSLLIYICNKTIGKEKYKEYEIDVINIKEKAEELKKYFIEGIEKDKEMLSRILKDYKNKCVLEDATKEAMDVIYKIYEVYDLVKKIKIYGNKNLISDFNILEHTIIGCIKSAFEDYEINSKGLENKNKYDIILQNSIDYTIL